jgi:hypothetical protein
MINKVKEARQKYKKGDYILSATGNLAVPQLIHGKIRMSENYKTIISDGFGVLYDGETDTWAEIVIIK